jgi:hypothetical protein
MRWLAACLVAGIVAAGCGLGSFDVTESVPAQTVPGTSSGAAAQPSAFETTMTLSANDLPRGSSLVDSVTLSSVSFNVMQPAGGTFDFVQNVTLSIYSPTNASLAEKQIATGQPTSGSGKLDLAPTDSVDLLPYVKAGAVVRAVGTGSAPANTTTFNGNVVLTVHLF